VTADRAHRSLINSTRWMCRTVAAGAW